MGIDYGSKRIGIAVSDDTKKYSFSRDYLLNDKNIFSRLMELMKNEKIEKIIIGYPVNLKSEKTVQSVEVEEFSKILSDHIKSNSLKIEIIYEDERFTSKLAEHNIISSGLSKKKRQDKGLTDSISAQIILQGYLDKTKIN
ncbi:MAG TPA: Holliday junction resolvase RuvX [Ignavibacteria bacterium]